MTVCRRDIGAARRAYRRCFSGTAPCSAGNNRPSRAHPRPTTLSETSPAAVVVKTLAELYEVLALVQDRAAFSGVEVFRRLEAETAEIAQRAQLAAAPFREVRLAGVLENGQAMLSRHGQRSVHVDSGSA